MYLPKLPNHLVGDDRDFLERWPALESWSAIPTLLGGDLPEVHQGTYRPVRSLTYLVMYQTFGTNPLPYHVFGIMVHVAATVLFTLVLARIPLLPKVAAFVAGMAFALHPLHTEAISFITASFDSLAFVWLFAALLSYQRQQSRLGLLLAILALGSNEVAYVLPLLLVALLWVCRQPLRDSRSVFVATLAVVAIRYVWVGVDNRGEYLGGSLLTGMAVSLKAAAHYLWLMVWPFDLGLLHRLLGGIPTYGYHDLYGVEVGLVQWHDLRVWIIAIGLLGLVLTSLAAVYKRRLWGLALVYVWVPLLPVINLVPSAVPLSERYAYLATTGFCLLLGLGSVRLKDKFRTEVFFLLLLLVGTLYAAKTLTMQSVWRDEIRYWEYQLSRDPDNQTGWVQLGKVYQVNYQIEQAIAAYKQALQLDDRLGNAWHNLGTIYQYQGQFDLAVMAYLNAKMRLTESSQMSSNMLQITRLYWAAEVLESDPAMAKLQQTLVKIELGEAGYQRVISEVCQQRPNLCRPIE